MSAFFDLWFGTRVESKPQYVRHGNADWVAHNFSEIPYWLSCPEKASNHKFVSTHEDDNYKLIILGQLYEKVTKNDLFNRCVKFIESSKKFDDPGGHYILFVLDKKGKSLHVFTNRFGTYQAYWLSGNGDNAIATPYINLAKQAKNKTLDWEGVTGFLAQGFFPNNRTYLECIKILEPATYYCFDKNLEKKVEKRYWDWDQNITEGKIDKTLEEIHESLSTSIAIATQNYKVALPISGGLDSRTLAGLITNSNSYSSLWGYSYGYSNASIETRIAKKIAKARDIPFDAYKLPNYLFDNIDVIAESVDLFQYIDGTRQASMINLLAEKSDVVIGGHWGDVWFDSMGVNSDKELLPYYRKKIIKRGSQWLMDNICKDYIRDPEELQNDYFNSYMSKYSYISDVDYRMKIFKTDQWSFRWTLPSIRMYQAGAMPVLPFYDKNVTNILTKIPSNVLAERGLQIEYIKKFFPDLAKIRWQEYGTNLYLYKKINNRNLVYRAAKKIQRTVTPNKHITRNWELFYLNKEGRERMEEIFCDKNILKLLPIRRLNKLLEDFYNNPTPSNGYTISMLHTFIQFLKKIN